MWPFSALNIPRALPFWVGWGAEKPLSEIPALNSHPPHHYSRRHGHVRAETPWAKGLNPTPRAAPLNPISREWGSFLIPPTLQREEILLTTYPLPPRIPGTLHPHKGPIPSSVPSLESKYLPAHHSIPVNKIGEPGPGKPS